MARTTAAAVKLVLRLGTQGGDYDDVNNPDLIPYIDAASAIVDDVVECANGETTVIGPARAELIERWLAAWAYAMSDQTYASRSTAGASASFHGQTGMNLDANKYGQTAQTLDPSGCLTAIGSRARIDAWWLGKTPSEQVDYQDRD